MGQCVAMNSRADNDDVTNAANPNPNTNVEASKDRMACPQAFDNSWDNKEKEIDSKESCYGSGESSKVVLEAYGVRSRSPSSASIFIPVPNGMNIASADTISADVNGQTMANENEAVAIGECKEMEVSQVSQVSNGNEIISNVVNNETRKTGVSRDVNHETQESCQTEFSSLELSLSLANRNSNDCDPSCHLSLSTQNSESLQMSKYTIEMDSENGYNNKIGQTKRKPIF